MASLLCWLGFYALFVTIWCLHKNLIPKKDLSFFTCANQFGYLAWQECGSNAGAACIFGDHIVGHNTRAEPCVSIFHDVFSRCFHPLLNSKARSWQVTQRKLWAQPFSVSSAINSSPFFLLLLGYASYDVSVFIHFSCKKTPTLNEVSNAIAAGDISTRYRPCESEVDEEYRQWVPENQLLNLLNLDMKNIEKQDKAKSMIQKTWEPSERKELLRKSYRATLWVWALFIVSTMHFHLAVFDDLWSAFWSSWIWGSRSGEDTVEHFEQSVERHAWRSSDLDENQLKFELRNELRECTGRNPWCHVD